MLPSKSQAPYELSGTLRIIPRDTEDPSDPNLELQWNEAGPDEHGRSVLNLIGQGWSRLLVEFEARIDKKTVKKILPTGTLANDTVMVMSVRCAITKVRHAVIMTQDPNDQYLWRGLVDIDRRDMRSRVVVLSMLCRKTDALSEIQGTAKDKNLLIAYSEPVVLQIDEVDRGSRSFVEFKSVDFRHSENPNLKNYPHNFYNLEIRRTGPIVWINSGHRNFHYTYREKASSGYTAALSEMLSLWLGESIWTQCFLAAFGSVSDPENEGDPEIPTDWRGKCLSAFVDRMFPDEPTTHERLMKALELNDSGNPSPGLLALVGAVSQELIKSKDIFESAVRIAENQHRSDQAVEQEESI